MSWKKVNSKRYQMEIDGAFTDVHVPYAKVEKLVEAFFANGGVVSSDGEVVTSVPVLIRNFAVMGDILLSKYDAKGELVESVGCRDLAVEEVTELFEIASDVISNFMEVISVAPGKESAQAQ